FSEFAESTASQEPPPYHLDARSFVLLTLMCVPIVFRRRNLLLTYALIQGFTLLAIATHAETDLVPAKAGDLFTTIVIFVVADGAPLWAAVLASFVELGILLLGFESMNPNPTPFKDALTGVTVYFPYWAFACFGGWALRRRRILTARLEA